MPFWCSCSRRGSYIAGTKVNVFRRALKAVRQGSEGPSRRPDDLSRMVQPLARHEGGFCRAVRPTMSTVSRGGESV